MTGRHEVLVADVSQAHDLALAIAATAREVGPKEPSQRNRGSERHRHLHRGLRAERSDVVTTYEEWRVTGDPGEGYPPYEFTWSPMRTTAFDGGETEARRFIALINEDGGGWVDGPHLHRRTVTVTEWEEAT